MCRNIIENCFARRNGALWNKKKVTIENIETKATISFNSAKESDEYARTKLGFTLKEVKKLRHEPVNGYRRYYVNKV